MNCLKLLFGGLFLLLGPVCAQQEVQKVMGLIAGSKMDPYLNIPLVSAWESEEVLDTAFLRVRYEMEFWNHLGDAKYQDFRMVEIGKTARHDYSERLYLYDSIAGAGGDMLTVEQETVYPAEWILLPDKRVRCRFRLVKLLPILQYEEKKGNLEWHLVQETDSIAGYVCQKAETEYRGREYEAWYCPAIPVDGGPYVFGGLPGLIIRVVDKRGDYSWEMRGLEKGRWPVTERQIVLQEVSPVQARKQIERVYANPCRIWKSMGYWITVHDMEKGDWHMATEDDIQDCGLFYTPIELE